MRESSAPALAFLAFAATGAQGQLGDGAAAASRSTPTTAIAVAAPAMATIDLDGLDADLAWAGATRVTGFREHSPEIDGDPTHPTEFRVLFTEDELYIFVRAFDAHPDSIMRALSRRDTRAPSDQIGVIIDSYDDRRTGFSFYVNPDGVQRDFAIYDDGHEDSSWNGVWDVATRIDELGWTAEFRIPLSQLRYADADEHVFGFGIRRDIERYPERLSWPVYDRTATGTVSQLGRLQGLQGLGSSRHIEFAPYFLTKNVTRAQPRAGFAHVQQAAVGGDLKVGLSPNVTLDATVNPDFGQVEADPAVLNLSAFETFFSERRPFFLEGTGLYAFQLNCYIVVDCQTNEGLFYSRRIGRAPTLGGMYGDERTPRSTPILGALKLTGRRPGGLSFGILDAVTGGVEGSQGRTAEPRSNYAVLRIQQDLRSGDAGIDWIATGVNRATDPWTSPYMHRSAYATGARVRTRFGDRNYEAQASFSVSRVIGTSEALVRTQRGSTHYYQQPGDDLALDSTRTSLSGYAAQVKVGKYSGGITRFETSYVHQSAGFDTNDLGYLRRADIHDWSTWASLNFQQPTSWYQWAFVNGNTWHHWNTAGTRLAASMNFNGHMGLHNNWNLHAGSTFNVLADTYCDRCTRGGPVLRTSDSFYPWLGVNADNRKMLAPGAWLNFGYWDEGASRSRSFNPYLNIRFSSSLRANLGVSLYQADNDSQWLGNLTDSGGTTRYAFAHLDQRTVSFNVRLNYTVSTDLSFEFYGQPFASSGEYTDVREVVAPDAVRYVDRFAPYTPPTGTSLSFSARQLRTNAVLRWEYLPGSAVFLVWAHGRGAYETDLKRRGWQDDLSDLFALRPDNTFLVKVSYWINR